MKIYRLIGIITTLQQQKTVTAPYLAEKFEVSRRTISRDIEDICKAGIPLVTTQGAGGGISIMEGFSLDTTVFTKQELAAIFTGLKSLDSVSRSASGETLARKIGGSQAVSLDDHMAIDLASHYKDDLASKLEQMKAAIQASRCISFRYYYEKGEADKLIEPCLLVFKWSDWYVFGFCRQRQDFRLYKLRRLWNLEVTQEPFSPREIPEEKKRFGSHMTDDYMVAALYDPSLKYRLVEEYGPACFTPQEDGRLYAEWGFTTRGTGRGMVPALRQKSESPGAAGDGGADESRTGRRPGFILRTISDQRYFAAISLQLSAKSDRATVCTVSIGSPASLPRSFLGISRIPLQCAQRIIRAHCLLLLRRPDSRNAPTSSALWSKSVPPVWPGIPTPCL